MGGARDASRNKLSGLQQKQEREYGANKQQLVFWDLSEDPENNANELTGSVVAGALTEREKKLGVSDSTHGLAFLKYDPSTAHNEVADGLGGLDITAYRVFEPDNWALRLHKERGRGVDGVWAVRCVADHENEAWKREHRSTMWVDQCDEQHYAHSQDLLWVKNVLTGATNDDEELEFDKAGFLAMLRGDDNPAKFDENKRAALCLNVAKNAGFYTDGVGLAHLWHVLHLSDPRPLEAQPTEPVPDCGFANQRVGTLRGDVIYDFDGRLAPMVINDNVIETRGCRLSGAFFVGAQPRFGTGERFEPPQSELALDPNSNQFVLDPAEFFGLRVFVEWPNFIPTPSRPGDGGWVPTNWPAVFTGVGGTKETPVLSDTSGTVAPHDLYAATGKDISTFYSVTMPEHIPDGWGMDVLVSFITPSSGFSGDVRMEMRAHLKQFNEDADVTVTTTSQVTILDLSSTNHPGSEVIRRQPFRISPNLIRDRQGGTMNFTISRAGNDDQLDDLRVLRVEVVFCDMQVETEPLNTASGGGGGPA